MVLGGPGIARFPIFMIADDIERPDWWSLFPARLDRPWISQAHLPYPRIRNCRRRVFWMAGTLRRLSYRLVPLAHHNDTEQSVASKG